MTKKEIKIKKENEGNIQPANSSPQTPMQLGEEAEAASLIKNVKAFADNIIKPKTDPQNGHTAIVSARNALDAIIQPGQSGLRVDKLSGISKDELTEVHKEIKLALKDLKSEDYIAAIESKEESGIVIKTVKISIVTFEFSIPAYILFFYSLQQQDYKKAIFYLSQISNFALLEQILPEEIQFNNKTLALRLNAEQSAILANAYVDGVNDSADEESKINAKALKQILRSKNVPVLLKDKVAVVLNGVSVILEDEIAKKIHEKIAEFQKFVCKDMSTSNSESASCYKYDKRLDRALLYFYSLSTVRQQSTFSLEELWTLRKFFLVNQRTDSFYKNIIACQIETAILAKITTILKDKGITSLIKLFENIKEWEDDPNKYLEKNWEPSIKNFFKQIANLEEFQKQAAALKPGKDNKLLIQFIARYAPTENLSPSVLTQAACYQAVDIYQKAKKDKAQNALPSLLGLKNFDSERFFDSFPKDISRQAVFDDLSEQLLLNQKNGYHWQLLQRLWMTKSKTYVLNYLQKLNENEGPSAIVDLIKKLVVYGNTEVLKFLISEFHEKLDIIINNTIDKQDAFLVEWKRVFAAYAPKVADELLIDIVKGMLAEVKQKSNTASADFKVDNTKHNLIQACFDRITEEGIKGAKFSIDELELLSKCGWIHQKLYGTALSKFPEVLNEIISEKSVVDSKIQEIIKRYLQVLKQYLNSYEIEGAFKDGIKTIYIETCFSNPAYFGNLSKEDITVKDCSDERLWRIARYIISSENEAVFSENFNNYYSLIPIEGKKRAIFASYLISAWQKKYSLPANDQIKLLKIKSFLSILFTNEEFKADANNPVFLEDFIKKVIPHVGADKLPLWSANSQEKFVFAQVVEQINRLSQTPAPESPVKIPKTPPESPVKKLKVLEESPVKTLKDAADKPKANSSSNLELLVALEREVSDSIIKSYKSSDDESCKAYTDYCLDFLAKIDSTDENNREKNLSGVKKLVVLLKATIDKFDDEKEQSNKQAYKFLIERILAKLIALFDFKEGEISQALMQNANYIVDMPEMIKALAHDPQWLLHFITKCVGDQSLDAINSVLLEMDIENPDPKLKMLLVAILLRKASSTSSANAAQIEQLKKAVNEKATLSAVLESFTDTDLQKMLALLSVNEQKVLLVESMQADVRLLTVKNKQGLLASFLEQAIPERISEILDNANIIKENILNLLSDPEGLALITEDSLLKVLEALPPQDLFAHFGVSLDSFSPAGGAAVDQRMLIPAKLARTILRNQTYLAHIKTSLPGVGHTNVMLKLLKKGFLPDSITTDNLKTLDANLAGIINRCNKSEIFEAIVLSVIRLKKSISAGARIVFSEEFLEKLDAGSVQRFLALCIPYLGHDAKKSKLEPLQQPLQEIIVYFAKSPTKKKWLLTLVQDAFSKEELLAKDLQISLIKYFELLQQNGLNLHIVAKKKKRSKTAATETGTVFFTECGLKEPFCSLAKLLAGNVNKSIIGTISEKELITPFIVEFIVSQTEDVTDKESINGFISLIEDIILARKNNITPSDYLTENFIASLGQIADEKLFEKLIGFISEVYQKYGIFKSDTLITGKASVVKAPKPRDQIYASLISKWKNENVKIASDYFQKQSSITSEEQYLVKALIESGREELWKNYQALLLPYMKPTNSADINSIALDICRLSLYFARNRYEDTLQHLSLKMSDEIVKSGSPTETLINKLSSLSFNDKRKLLNHQREKFLGCNISKVYFEAIVKGLSFVDIVKLLEDDSYGEVYTSEQCFILLAELTQEQRKDFFTAHIQHANLGVLSAVFSFRNDNLIEKFKEDAVIRFAEHGLGNRAGFERISLEVLDAIADYPELQSSRMQEIHQFYEVNPESKQKRFVERLYEKRQLSEGRKPEISKPIGYQFHQFVFKNRKVLQGTDIKMQDIMSQAAKSGMTLQQFLAFLKAEKDVISTEKNITSSDILVFLKEYQSVSESSKEELNIVGEIITEYLERAKSEKKQRINSTGNASSKEIEISKEIDDLYYKCFMICKSNLIKDGIANRVMADSTLYNNNYTIKSYLEHLMLSDEEIITSLEDSVQRIEEISSVLELSGETSEAEKASLELLLQVKQEQVPRLKVSLQKNQEENANMIEDYFKALKAHTVQKARDAQYMLADIIEKDQKFAINYPKLKQIAETVKLELEHEELKENSWIYRKIVAPILRWNPVYVPSIYEPKVLEMSLTGNVIDISAKGAKDSNCLIILKRKGWFSPSSRYLLKDVQENLIEINEDDYRKDWAKKSVIYEVNVSEVKNVWIVSGDSKFEVELIRKDLGEIVDSKQAPASAPPSPIKIKGTPQKSVDLNSSTVMSDQSSVNGDSMQSKKRLNFS